MPRDASIGSGTLCICRLFCAGVKSQFEHTKHITCLGDKEKSTFFGLRQHCSLISRRSRAQKGSSKALHRLPMQSCRRVTEAQHVNRLELFTPTPYNFRLKSITMLLLVLSHAWARSRLHLMPSTSHYVHTPLARPRNRGSAFASCLHVFCNWFGASDVRSRPSQSNHTRQARFKDLS